MPISTTKSIVQAAQEALPHTCLDGNLKPLSFVSNSPEEIGQGSRELLRRFSTRRWLYPVVRLRDSAGGQAGERGRHGRGGAPTGIMACHN